ncbi:MAG: hypothetical protein K0B00_01695 [Rhodobacteraceae bacterium]|nr:hypothetical protein [Paracoccaceae bacterium]
MNAQLKVLSGQDAVRFLERDQMGYVARDPSGWIRLFRDRETAVYWLLEYPDSSSHGGGPPRLTPLFVFEETSE